jgi:hypothetical protein
MRCSPVLQQFVNAWLTNCAHSLAFIHNCVISGGAGDLFPVRSNLLYIRLSMTIRTICLLAALGAGVPGRTQHLDYNRFELLKRGGSQAATVDAQYDDVKGSAWFSDWQPAVLLGEDGRRYSDLKARIDLYKSIAYIKLNDTVYNINGTSITRIVLHPGQDDSVVFQRGFSSPGVRAEQFLQVLATGKLGLVKQWAVELKDVHEDALSSVKTFVTQDYYYLVRPSGQIETVKPGRKLFEQEMGENWKAVSAYAKEKDISFNQEEGWILLLKFYNSL